MLQALEIVNFKCFASQRVSLRQLTVLAGANGMGKSTIIQALLLMRQTVEGYYDFDNWISLISTSHFRVLLNGPYMLRLGNASEIINSISNSNTIQFSATNISNKQLHFNYDVIEGNLSLLLNKSADKNPSFSDFSICNNEFHYLNAERYGPRNIQEAVDQDFINTGCQGEYTGHAIASAEALNRKLGRSDKRLIRVNDEVYYSLRKQIEAWMAFVIPNIQLKVEPFPQINSVRISLRNASSETAFLHPSNIGFGISYSLPIIVSGLIARKGSMLIVENPEAHLHPSGQSRIGQFLAHIAAAGVQVVIETHSEHIINGIRLAVLKETISPQDININFFSQPGKSAAPTIESITLDDQAELSEWPSGFLDQEEQDLADIFRMKKK